MKERLYKGHTRITMQRHKTSLLLCLLHAITPFLFSFNNMFGEITLLILRNTSKR